jgi:hypothetical protein
MTSDESALALISEIYAKATQLCGDDPAKVAGCVRRLIEALDPANRAAVTSAFERMISFHAPVWPPREIFH